MDNRSDGLWQGGPWEQPARPLSPPPAVVIPPQKYRPPRPPQRRHSGRIGFLIALALIVSLTALAVLFNGGLAPRSADPVPSGSDPGYSSWEQEEDLSAPPSIPQAETGTGVILSITPPSGEALTYTQVYEKAAPSIAALTAYSAGMVSTGTGIVLTADGYIVTNAHIIAGAEQVNVTLSDDSLWSAQLVGFEPLEDLAVLKIDCAGLPPAQFGDSTLLEVGDAVAAIGNPLGEELRGTMTDGIISAINRDVNVDGYTMVLLQTTAALNSGNSGGALINDRGQVVGITNLKMRAYDNTVEGLGFAIPTTTVKTVVDALIAHGRVEGRPTIGITGYTVTEELAEEYGCPRGVAVQSVREGSDAQRQGVLPNDVIVAVNGETITDMDQLQAIKEGLAVGDVLTFRLWRGGHYLERDVALVDQYTLEE